MPGYNHYPNCLCGWCEGGWRGRTRSWRHNATSSSSFAYHSSLRELAVKLGNSLLLPTICRYCGQLIYLYASPDGSFVIFDSVGKPWPKHVCSGVGLTDHRYQVDYIKSHGNQILPIPDYIEHITVRETQVFVGVIARHVDIDVVDVFDGHFLSRVHVSIPVRIGMLVTGTIALSNDILVLQVTDVHEPSKADVRSLNQRVHRAASAPPSKGEAISPVAQSDSCPGSLPGHAVPSHPRCTGNDIARESGASRRLVAKPGRAARETLLADGQDNPRSSQLARDPMAKLFDTIRQLVAEEKYVVGDHASERLQERGIMDWQVVAGLEMGELIAERPDATPNPAVEVRETLPDGTEFKAVWSHLRQSGVAKLVTIHFFDRD